MPTTLDYLETRYAAQARAQRAAIQHVGRGEVDLAMAWLAEYKRATLAVIDAEEAAVALGLLDPHEASFCDVLNSQRHDTKQLH
jgi:hypothetical protein